MILLVWKTRRPFAGGLENVPKEGLLRLEAANGNIAVDLLRHYKGDIALIILDVNLPGLSSRVYLTKFGVLNPGCL